MVSRSLLMAVLALGTCIELVGCAQPCNSNEVELEVHGGKGGYVCMPRDDDPSTTAPATPIVDAGKDAVPDASPHNNGSCETVYATGLNVPVLERSGAPAVVQSTVIPDGQYDLLQWTYYPGTATVFDPAKTVRAHLIVKGQTVELGLVPDLASQAANESFTATLANDTLTILCESTTGQELDWVAPGGVGSSEQAQASYDATTLTTRIVLTNAHGQLELYFK